MSCTCILTNAPKFSGLPVITAIEGGKKTVTVLLSDVVGSESQPADITAADSIRFILKKSSEDTQLYMDTTALPGDDPGEVVLELMPQFPGMWLGAFILYDEDGYTIDQYACWVQVTKAMDSPYAVSALTVPEVRSFLWDRCGADNKILDDMQFADEQIMDAMRQAIDEWNDTPPDVARYTTTDFPYRHAWLIGTSAYLLRSLAINMIRNNATFATGTVTVNENDKGPVFKAISDQLFDEYRTWVMRKKREININQGWGGSHITAF